MRKCFLLYLVHLGLLYNYVKASDPAIEEEEIRARAYIQLLNEKTAKRANEASIANWNYASNITDENLKKQLEVSARVAKETKEDWLETIKFNWKSFSDPDLYRQFKKYSILGTAALPEDKYTKLDKIISDMQTIYSTAKICDFKTKDKCDLALEPEITNILIKSRDAEELKQIWLQWRNKTAAAKDLFKDYVSLSNEAATLNNFTDTADYWLYGYEAADFKDQVKKLWEQLRPLYLQIHAYVRTKLRERYGDIVSEKGPIPAHLLGNMWAQTWGHIFDFTMPSPGAQKLDVTEEMVKQGYTPEKMFKLSEEFFTSLNLSAMTDLFWERSILEKPKDGRELICHASAWDFYDQKDFRIKQCTRVDFTDLITAHHEMGHIQYYLQYKSQPQVFREGANDGFHEAVGDVMSLSVSTTKHLKKIGLIGADVPDNDDNDLNNLYKIGLDKIVFLPFGYLMDLWRWDVFEGKTSPEDYNCNWWKYRNEIQGIEPPVDRSEKDFDPAAKYHIVADVPYLRYFVSYVIQFQFHRAACEIAGEYDASDPKKPLHKCDIYQSTAAGNAIGKMLQLGSSRPWPDAMQALTGQREMDASGLLEYFKPLQKYLEEENKKNNAFIGWEASTKKCSKAS
ncbi:hypothetical protein ILUMI_09783 [Ignelater luminosus]|uniref:Angiotensin-converting enzyme n=1 Tax=Ignelater luminosus TaxID=2038154 RepID=A0A8K0CZB7_IGNLU|nr:hypothetical protein ILUMI_09783 [Ignelater luminosus]